MKTALHTLRLVFDQREEVEQRCGIRLRAHPRKQAPVAELELGFVCPVPRNLGLLFAFVLQMFAQILAGLFSAVSKPMFASKNAFGSIVNLERSFLENEYLLA